MINGKILFILSTPCSWQPRRGPTIKRRAGAHIHSESWNLPLLRSSHQEFISHHKTTVGTSRKAQSSFTPSGPLLQPISSCPTALSVSNHKDRCGGGCRRGRPCRPFARLAAASIRDVFPLSGQVTTIFPNPRMIILGFMAPSTFGLRLAFSIVVHASLLSLIVLVGQSRLRVLTPSGLRHAMFLGVLLWTCMGPAAWGQCVLFLIVGSIATRMGMVRKERLGIAEKRGGARGPANLWGAAGAAAIIAVLATAVEMFGPSALHGGKINQALHVAFVAALASKTSDTCASEIGKAYGSRTYLVTTGKEVPRGTEGAVSGEGTAAGIAGSILAAAYARSVGLLTGTDGFIIVTVASLIANFAESFLGATVQESRKWSNEFVNFLNTSIGAIVALVLYTLM